MVPYSNASTQENQFRYTGELYNRQCRQKKKHTDCLQFGIFRTEGIDSKLMIYLSVSGLQGINSCRLQK